jgi:hypothetical protein
MQTRLEMGNYLNQLNLNGLGVEIGVLRGEHAENLLKRWNCEKLFLIDLWEHRLIKKYYHVVEKKFRGNDKVQIMKMDSHQASKEFMDESLDFIYIDADHSFKGVASDIISWYPKLKRFGVLAGHDYREDGKYWDGFYGVKTAVDSLSKMLQLKPTIIDEGINSTWYFRREP